MNHPEQIEFAYPKWIAIPALWLWLPLMALIILMIVASALFGLYSAHARAVLNLFAYAKAIVVLCTGFWMGGTLVHWVRDRHTFKTRYLLSEQGIFAQEVTSEGSLYLWSDVAMCVDSRLGRYIQLRSSKFQQPVTLQFGTPGAPRVSPEVKLELARRLIREKLGCRYERIWW